MLDMPWCYGWASLGRMRSCFLPYMHLKCIPCISTMPALQKSNRRRCFQGFNSSSNYYCLIQFKKYEWSGKKNLLTTINHTDIKLSQKKNSLWFINWRFCWYQSEQQVEIGKGLRDWGRLDYCDHGRPKIKVICDCISEY